MLLGAELPFRGDLSLSEREEQAESGLRVGERAVLFTVTSSH